MIKDTKHNLFKGERKSLTETLEEKGKRLTTRRGCEKRRMATESEESMEKKKNEQINLLNLEQRDWQPNLGFKDKKLQVNLQNVEKRDCSTNVNIRNKKMKVIQQTILEKRNW